MMVETILESSQDFGMSMASLPQWKRELLQRRAARSRGAAPSAPAAPPPPPPPSAARDDDEELCYGPGIVKRLKSRYLSLALRDAPRRRPSVLRRAASLEHLLDERPPPAPRPAARTPRPASVAAPSALARRDFVKRARSVDALSRLESREDPPASPPPAPPAAPPPPPPAPPRPVAAARPPRRPAPLLRDTERPPPDLVRSTLRKFEPAPVRRTAPAARVSAALRGLERGTTPTPEPRSPSPLHTPESRFAEECEGAATSTPRAVSRAALEGIARAGSSTRYAFEAPRRGSHLPPLAATNPVMLGRARRVGVIRPMPAPPLERAVSASITAMEEITDKSEDSRLSESRVLDETPVAPSPAPSDPEPMSPRSDRRDTPSALVEPIPRSPPEEAPPLLPRSPPPVPCERTHEASPIAKSDPKPDINTKPKILLNGHANPPRSPEMKPKETVIMRETKPKELIIETTEPEVPWNGVTLKKTVVTEKSNGSPVLKTKAPVVVENKANGSPVLKARGVGGVRGSVGGGSRGAPEPASVVFNFSHRKEVPDYIENDGLILRASRRDRIKAGEPGVVVLNPELLLSSGGGGGDSDEGEGEVDGGPPSPCSVRFFNDNVLINGRSSMPCKPNKDRIARLKLQFDDSLTRTFEYPSETSLCEGGEGDITASPTPLAPATGSPMPAPPDTPAATLTANTHISSTTLGRYTPHKTCADAFQLGVSRHVPSPPTPAPPTPATQHANGTSEPDGSVSVAGAGEAAVAGAGAGGGGDARPCGADARSWSDARALATDLLF